MMRLTDASLLEEAAQAAEQDKGSPENRPTQVLVRLCDWVETKMGGVIELEKADEILASAVHQVRATCECFGPVIDSEDGLGFINPADFE